MANYPSKMKLPKVDKRYGKFDLSCDHITTTDFFKFKPIFAREMVANDTFTGSVETLTRTSPLAVPSFSRVVLHNRQFFVPFRCVWEYWNSFITASPDRTGGAPTSVPYFTNADVVELFFEHDQTSEDFSFCHVLSDEEQHSLVTDFIVQVYEYDEEEEEDVLVDKYIRLTALGQRVYDIFTGIGFNINWTMADESKFSVLPLLCYFKIIFDWYMPSEYSSKWSQDIICDTRGGHYSFASIPWSILSHTNYSPDKYTQVWDNPVGPNTLDSQAIDIISSQGLQSNNEKHVAYGEVYLGSDLSIDRPVISTNDVGDKFFDSISQQDLNTLHAVTEYMIRNQVAGFREWDRYFAHFGCHLDSEQFKRSMYLGSDDSIIKISEVVANSTNSVDNQPLGDLAGRGIGHTQGGFNFSTQEYGFFIIISSVEPKTGYYQGRSRELTHGIFGGRLSFFHPEFDNLGVQAMRQDEVYADFGNVANHYGEFDGLDPESIFGYVPMYEEYKTATDRVSGNFRLNSKNALLTGYHVMRDLTRLHTEDDQEDWLIHDSNFLKGDQAQFDRIFNTADYSDSLVDGGLFDHFIQWHYITCHATRPMCSLAESLLDEENLEDKKVAMPTNGTQLN